MGSLTRNIVGKTLQPIISHYSSKLHKMAWHDGVWWPLYTTAWYSPHVSEYMFDPYSLTHVLHGIFFQLILGMIMQSNFGAFLIAMMLELFWEVVENSEAVIRKFLCCRVCFGQNLGDFWAGLGPLRLDYSLGDILHHLHEGQPHSHLDHTHF